MFVTERKTYVRPPAPGERERSYDQVLDLNSEAKFWSKVNMLAPNGCWEWLGACVEDGYGRMRLAKRPSAAHRLAYTTYVGPTETGEVVRHKCDNPPCVNPAHLETGTPADNVRDRDTRGRTARVSFRDHWNASPSEVRSRAEALFGTGLSQAEIGRTVGVSQPTIHRWQRGDRVG